MPDLQARCLRDSRFWFPFGKPKHNTERDHEIIHQAFGIAGEAGEVVEHIKKWHRGSRKINKKKIAAELADVVIYCMNLAEILGVDLEAAIHAKRKFNVQRWGEPK